MKNLLSMLIFAMLICVSDNAFGQNIDSFIDTTKTYKIELKDGSVFFGNMLRKDSISIVIKTSLIPNLEIPFSKIEIIDEIEMDNLMNGNYWFPNPHSTRYLFGPSAFNLKKGEGYYQNTMIILNSFNVGITNTLSIGGGFEILSTFGSMTSEDGFKPIFLITPKVGFKVAEKFHAGGGVLYVNIPDFGSGSSGLGIVYGIGTYGSLDHNITGGIGWGYVVGEFQERPIITFSGMTRVSKKTALVTENWLIPTNDYYGIYSYGIRFFGEKMSVDLSFINNTDIAEGLFIGIPYVSFVVKF